jgi:DNA-binding protein YbaB
MTTANGSPPIGSAAWLEDLQQRTTRLQEDIGNAVVTFRSPDQAVTVTVGPNGALLNLSLGHRAAEHTHTQLGPLIMSTVRAAQRKAAERVSEAFVPFGSPELTEHTRKFLTYLPPEDDQDDTATEDEPVNDFVPDDLVEQQAEQPAPLSTPLSVTPPPRGRPRRGAAADDPDDELEPW